MLSDKRKNYISKDESYMAIAKIISMRSKDPNTQVGAVIVSNEDRILSIGYNGFPNGCTDDRLPWKRENDYVESDIDFLNRTHPLPIKIKIIYDSQEDFYQEYTPDFCYVSLTNSGSEKYNIAASKEPCYYVARKLSDTWESCGNYKPEHIDAVISDKDENGNYLRLVDKENVKYPYVIHAEANAIMNFKGDNSKLKDASIYVTLFPCHECTKLIIQSGIKRIYYYDNKYKDTSDYKEAKIMFDMAGVELIELNKFNGDIYKLMKL